VTSPQHELETMRQNQLRRMIERKKSMVSTFAPEHQLSEDRNTLVENSLLVKPRSCT
jgi:hypothetical protein